MLVQMFYNFFVPRFSDPLLVEISQLRSGHCAAEMTPQELSVFEDRLIKNVDSTIAVLEGILVYVHDRTVSLPGKELNDYLKGARLMARIINKLNYLSRFKFWHQQRLQSFEDFKTALLNHEAEPLLSDPGKNRSSIKTQKIYSKFPPRQASMDLTNEQWQLIQHLLPRKEVVAVGRPPQSMREVLNAIMWKIRTGAPWDQIPFEYPSHQTCYRYYTAWMRDESLDKIIKILGKDLADRGGLDLYSAVQSGEIQILRMGRKYHIALPPRMQDTWKGSTALTILQFRFKNLPQSTKHVMENRPSKLANIQELTAIRKPSQ